MTVIFQINHKPMLNYTRAFSSFSVDDLPAAKKFYTETLGLGAEEGDGDLTILMADDYRVMVYPKPDHKPATFTILNFMVDDIEDAVEKLSSLGIKFEQYGGAIKTDEKGISRGWGHAMAWFKDPAGNILSVLAEE